MSEKAQLGEANRLQYRCGLTIVTEEARWPLGFEGNEGSDEVVDDGCDEDNKQEDLSLHRSK